MNPTGVPNEVPSEMAIEPFSVLQWGITPWTVLLLCLLPLVLLVSLGRTFPSRRMVWLAALPLIVSLPIPWLTSGWANWWGWTVAALGFALALIVTLDLFSLPLPRLIHVERTMQRVASLGNRHSVELSIDNHNSR
ncbi:MAG: hypothetical protein KDA51_06150, partial [Planctomycetales bacterium]|nr:hypothetical protein [Planctomycetales bacterium]